MINFHTQLKKSWTFRRVQKSRPEQKRVILAALSALTWGQSILQTNGMYLFDNVPSNNNVARQDYSHSLLLSSSVPLSTGMPFNASMHMKNGAKRSNKLLASSNGSLITRRQRTNHSRQLNPLTFQYFPLYTLDNINGVVLFPNNYQQATLGSNVDLRAQVRDTTGVTFSWNTTNLTHATGISGAATYNLTFNWETTNSTAAVDSVTLTTTNGSSQQQIQTYYFLVPAGSGSTTGTASWASSLSPDTVQAHSTRAWASQHVSVDANSGALDTTLQMPSYNPNVPALALTYDSLTADPRPIVIVSHTLDPAQVVPTMVSAQLGLNGTGSTYYYNTSQFTSGDVEQISLQSGLVSSTDRYSYTATVIDYRAARTTTTATGTATILNQSTSPYGDGWIVADLERIYTPTGGGGVILALGSGGRTLWFSGSPGTGSNYTSPAGEFSTLTKTASGYTQTLPTGYQLTFNSNGYQTAIIDLSGLHTTFTYDASSRVATIIDAYSNLTTFTYSGSVLQSIKDPAGRLTTFSFTGANLTAVQQADGSRTTYTYDAAGRMTSLKDADSHIVTIAYDSAERVGTITRPDSSVQTFTAYQEAGYNTTGTAGSPARAELWAEACSTYTDARSNATNFRADWWGLGRTGQMTDALGNVVTYDRNSNGLATVVVDQLGQISQYVYDSLGNIVTHVYPDNNKEQRTYNSFSESLVYTKPNLQRTDYAYDSNGNLTTITDNLANVTTMTYTANGRLKTFTDTNGHITTYTYDNQDRRVTISFPDSTFNTYSYDNQGDITTFTDGRNNATTYSYDTLNRKTGITDALGNKTTSTYDSVGNITTLQASTPSGQTARTTTYAYDSMNRQTTVTDPLGNITTSAYDSNGNLTTLTDALGHVTTTAYDALNRVTTVTDAMGKQTTYSYDADGQKLTSTDPLGRITTTTYNNRGLIYTVTDPLSNISTYTYTATGKLSEQSAPIGSGSSNNFVSYDNLDRVWYRTDPNSQITTYNYDGVSNCTGMTNGLSKTTTYAYDSRNRLTTVTDPLGHITTYSYDNSGNQQSIADGLGHITTTLYDALNRVTTTVSPILGTMVAAYDTAYRQTTLTDAVNNVSTWAYDADDRVTTFTDPLGKLSTYVYDAINDLTDKTDRNGRRTTYSYDKDKRMTGETWVGASPAEIITYTYDAAGQRTNVADVNATLTMAYDKDSRLGTMITSGPGTGQPTITLTYGREPSGHLTTLTDSRATAGVTTYVYDPGFRITSIGYTLAGVAGPQVGYTYDDASRITQMTRGTGSFILNQSSYDDANRLLTNIYVQHSFMNTNIATFVYAYDNANRVTTETNKEGVATYTYDAVNELTAVGDSRTESYSYDKNGNRNGTGYTVGTGNEQTVAPGLVTYTYDNEGNITVAKGASTATYTYDYHNRLIGAQAAGVAVATYIYDGLGHRISINENSTPIWTVYADQYLEAPTYADFNSSGTLTHYYVYGPAPIAGVVQDGPLARTDGSGNATFYLLNGFGSVRDIYTVGGSLQDHIIYDSFGQVTSETNASNGDRFKYALLEYSSTLSQHYARARNYIPFIGRFTARDPKDFTAGDANLYRYVGNNPVNLIDPSGLQVVIPPPSSLPPPPQPDPYAKPLETLPMTPGHIYSPGYLMGWWVSPTGQMYGIYSPPPATIPYNNFNYDPLALSNLLSPPGILSPPGYLNSGPLSGPPFLFNYNPNPLPIPMGPPLLIPPKLSAGPEYIQGTNPALYYDPITGTYFGPGTMPRR